MRMEIFTASGCVVRRRAIASAAPTTRRAPRQTWSRGLTFDDVVDILKASVANAQAYAKNGKGESQRAVTETLDMVRSAPRPSPPRASPPPAPPRPDSSFKSPVASSPISSSSSRPSSRTRWSNTTTS